MSAEAFANGLLSIVDGMEFKGSKFDKTKLHNGKISLALFGPEKITTNDGELYAGKTAHWNLTAEGKYKITYQKISGEFLTVESIRATLGVHEYFGHGDRGLVHPTDNEEIEQLEKEYIDNR